MYTSGHFEVYPRDIPETALAHSIGTEVETAYLRTDLFDKRRALMKDWEKHCMTPSPSEK